MAITSEANRTAELATDGVETEFDFSLLIHAEDELQVWYKATGDDYSQLTLNTDYTVVFSEPGGTITTIGASSPRAAGSILIIRHLPITQQTNWLYNDNHTGQTHQDDFDRTVMRDLQIQEQLDRAVGFNITSSTKDIEFPEPLSDNIIGWNTAGDALENKAGVTGIVLLPAADGNFIVGDGTSWIVESGAIARASLGLTIGSDIQAWSANLDSIDQDLGIGDSPTWVGATLSGLTATRVLFARASGVISDDAGFTFASGVLTAGTYNATDEDNALQIDGTTFLRTGTAANNNVFVGEGVFSNDDGINNLGIGFEAGKNNDTTGGVNNGLYNVYIGFNAGKGGAGGSTGFSNFALGNLALGRITSGARNVAIGGGALGHLTLGGVNIAIGEAALSQITITSNNTAIGRQALTSNTGSTNVGIGSQAGQNNTSGNDNTIIGGVNAFLFNKTGSRNIVIGSWGALGVSNSSNVSNNVYIGYKSGFSILTGADDNVFLGNQSGYRQTTNSNLLIIDNQDRGSAAAELTDCMIYGVFNPTVTSQSIRFNVGDLALASGTPYQTLWNITHEDTDGGRESRLNFKGEQSGGEVTTLARIEIGHDGAADDEKGFIDGYTNSGSDGDSPTKQIRIQSTGDWVINKTSGIGIKVDLSAPTFGFADLLGDQFSKNTGGTKPTLVAYNGAVDAWQFSDGDEAFLTYHIPHDYVPGTDIHLHIHWSQNNAGATGGTIDFKYFAIYAKGHNQASGSTFTSTPITATFSSIDINDGGSGLTQYQQHLTEVTISAASATVALFDRDDFEPDGVIELTLEMDANNLTGTPSDPFIHYADIHYQTTGVIGTKSRTPNFYT